MLLKGNNEAHVGNIISTDINNDAMSISKACNETYTKLNLLYINLVCVHQMLYINCSIVIICHCMEVSDRFSVYCLDKMCSTHFYITFRVTHIVN